MPKLQLLPGVQGPPVQLVRPAAEGVREESRIEDQEMPRWAIQLWMAVYLAVAVGALVYLIFYVAPRHGWN
ncbi:MAG: hypothetical protein UY99_C0001G0034 [Parcubacteria group bacterium GW2011_GWA1_59_11]|nr:MAG: hypothetical protein UY99_C0001G0034 [Parcubacteria group bacterium GW2011_GWA1_59_11]